MSITVITRTADEQPHVIAAADRWSVDDKGYLTLYGPTSVVAQFAPGWVCAIDNELGQNAP